MGHFIIKTKSGFTLIEMIIVMVMVAVLAAVAIPMYTDYVESSRRSEGVAAVLAVLTGAKTFYQNNGSFPTGTLPLAGLDVDVADALAHWGITITDGGTSCVIRADGNTGGYVGLSAILTYTLGAASNTTVIVDENGSTIFN